jgi:hypothetical protein
MNNNTIVRLSIAALTTAALAACGGGGSGSSTSSVITPAAKASTSPGGGSSPASFVNGTTKMTVSFTRSASKPHTKSTALKSAASRKSPTFVSESTSGFQVTVTAGSQAPAVYNIDFLNNTTMCQQTTSSTFTCTLSVPTLGPTETINVVDVDEAPTGTIDPATGIATGPFPGGTAILANGTTTATLTPGGITTVAMSLNPVISEWYDCGGVSYNNNSVMQVDGSYGPSPRIVVTGNAASSGTLRTYASDYDGWAPTAVSATVGGPLIGQPFVDVDGTATPLTAVSTLANFTVLPLVNFTGNWPAPPTSGSYTTNASIPDSSYSSPFNDGMFIAIRYDGFGTPNGAMKTLTLLNNLSVTPPSFTGATNYSTTFTYGIAPVFATAASPTATHSTSTLLVTGYDPGATNSMGADNCVDGNGNSLGSETPSVAITNGVETFVFNASSTTGTCTFKLYDTNTGVRSNPVLVTIQ